MAWMTWKDNLREASFRGKKFFVADSDMSIGRRTRTRQYKNRKAVYVQDLGADKVSFKLEGYVIQNPDNDFDYFQERDDLIEALSEKGKGKLVHPFYGEVDVALTEAATVKESFNEGGIARFSMTFTITGRNRLPQKTKDHLSLIDALGELMAAAGLDDFAGRFVDAANAVGDIANDITTTLNAVQNAINGIRAGINTAISAATGAISGILSTIDSILDAPCDIAAALMGAADAFQNCVGMAGEVFTGGVVGLCSDELSSSSGSPVVLNGTSIPENLGASTIQAIVGASGIDESAFENTSPDALANRRAILDVTKLGLLINGARIAMRIDFSNQEKLNETVELLSGAMDDFMTRLGDQDPDADSSGTFIAIQKIKASFVDNMYDRGKNLTQIVSYQVSYGVENALTLAYDKYDDLDRVDEIMALNRSTTQNPGFLPSGDEVRVLND